MSTEEKTIRPEKVASVAELKERIQGSQIAIITSYQGINVEAVNGLRKKLREAGVEAYAQGEARLRLHFAEPLDGTQLAAMVRLPGPADQGPYPPSSSTPGMPQPTRTTPSRSRCSHPRSATQRSR